VATFAQVLKREPVFGDAIPFPHLAGRSVTPKISKRRYWASTQSPRRKRLGHKATQRRWRRQGRR
jgi:hypothetical protein